MTGRQGLLLALLLIPALALPSACARVVNPATGQTEFTAMSPAQEQEIGEEQHPQVLMQFGGPYDDAELQSYVSRIGDELAAVSELPELDFTFTVLNSEVINAFALPGGYVYITRGLLALADNEAELAGVMAHEIGHVTARHSAQRYSRGVLAQGGLAIGTVLAGVLGGGAAADLVQQAGGLGAQAYLAGYSRDQEFQADELGVRYMARAGYDPTAMSSFLEKLERNDQLMRRLSGPRRRGSRVQLVRHAPAHARSGAARRRAGERRDRRARIAPGARTISSRSTAWFTARTRARVSCAAAPSCTRSCALPSTCRRATASSTRPRR